MYGNNNNKIEIEKVENGYVVTVVITENKSESPLDIVNHMMPMFERIQNKAMGEDWKDKLQDEIDGAVKVQPLKPVRQFVCADWKAVLKIINAENF